MPQTSISEKNMSELIEHAKQEYKSLGIEELAKAGFKKDLLSRAHSHHTVTYPERDSTDIVCQSEIFGGYTPEILALYFHFPDCVGGRCSYCNYTSFADRREEDKDLYRMFLNREADLALQIPGIRDSVVHYVYFGGGTPTSYSVQQLRDILGIIGRFNLAQDLEFTVEFHPLTILGQEGEDKLAVLKEGRVNRLSGGAQSFNDNILRDMHRRHNSDDIYFSVKQAKKYFRNINLDLIMGYPGQSLETWEQDLESFSMLGVPSLTAYPLTIKPFLGLWYRFEKSPQDFPTGREAIQMHLMAKNKFSKLGWIEFPVWWFVSSPDFIIRQQVHKWQNNGAMLGFGLDSYSYINNWQTYNYRDLPTYFYELLYGNLPISRGAELTKEEQARRNLLFGVRCKIDKQDFRARYGFLPEERFGREIKYLRELGLIEDTSSSITPTTQGKLLSEDVSRFFIPENVK